MQSIIFHSLQCLTSQYSSSRCNKKSYRQRRHREKLQNQSAAKWGKTNLVILTYFIRSLPYSCLYFIHFKPCSYSHSWKVFSVRALYWWRQWLTMRSWPVHYCSWNRLRSNWRKRRVQVLQRYVTHCLLSGFLLPLSVSLHHCFPKTFSKRLRILRTRLLTCKALGWQKRTEVSWPWSSLFYIYTCNSLYQIMQNCRRRYHNSLMKWTHLRIVQKLLNPKVSKFNCEVKVFFSLPCSFMSWCL